METINTKEELIEKIREGYHRQITAKKRSDGSYRSAVLESPMVPAITVNIKLFRELVQDRVLHVVHQDGNTVMFAYGNLYFD